HFKTRKLPAEMTVNFLGLAGCLGALDTPTTELILQRTSRNDVALRDFLDIFNHRLVSLLYRIRKLHRVGLGVAEPGKDHISRYLYALIGLETPKLKGRMHVRDRALLYYAGILAHQTRSMAGLERMLSDYFQVPVKGRQFSGKWCDLEENQWTIIGESGRNQRLGQDMVVVGTRVWDEHARFEIHMGPLSLKDFISFLPTNYHFGVLCDLIRFYVKDEFDFNIRLILNADEIPGTKLWPTAPELPELAWTAWLGVPQARSDGSNGNGAGSKDKPEDPYITVSPEALEAESPSLKSRILYRLPRGKQEALLDMMTPRTVPKHSVVMAQDKPGTHMFVIRSGTVQLFRREAQGKERLMGILKEGDSFGELALLTRKPYSETALAVTKCQLAVVDRQQLDALVLKYPRLQRTIDSYLDYGDPGKQSVEHLEKRRR
ncbi:MAG TPA: type VI secretion system baseplate subunit TssG, partial [Pyrinomonadaceae bacterium]|nr:type VI secretion system baseplate subunit TssG [Pyrinomonadaceae bacterium]